MSKYYVAVGTGLGGDYYTGGSYILGGETYPNISSRREDAKKYKSRKTLENIIANGKIATGGGWYWEIEEINTEDEE